MFYKFLFYKFLSVCIALALPLIGDEGKVLVITPNSLLHHGLEFRLGVEGYRVVVEPCENIMADSGQIEQLVQREKPDFVVVDSVGAELVDSLLIDTHVINAANQANVKKTIVLASYDVYPKKLALPYKESALSTNRLEWEDDPYRIAKLTALKTCQALNGLGRPRFLFIVHPLLYGPQDSGFVPQATHPVKCIASRVLKAKKELKDFSPVPNDGEAMYELLHVDDLAKALAMLMQTPTEHDIFNIGTGREVCIDEIAIYIKNYFNFKGKLLLDPNCYDEVPRKVLDCTRITSLGFSPSITHQEGLKETVVWLEANSPKSDFPLQANLR